MVEYLRKLWRKKIMQFIVTNLEEIYTLFFLFFNKKGKMITTIPGSTKKKYNDYNTFFIIRANAVITQSRNA
jgi:hypothetical protein